MLHARKDYDHIQDETGNIGEDEPVFLLRAKDRLAPATLDAWANLLVASGGDIDTAAHVREWAIKMRDWQEENGDKIPDVEKEDRRPAKEQA